MKTIAQIIHKKKFPLYIFDYNSKGSNVIYGENLEGYWWKSRFDSNGGRIYLENSNGLIEYNMQ